MSILKELDYLRIPLRDIKQATNNFARENAIGPGGYGIVYKGELLRSEGLVSIAAKRVDQRYLHSESHFLNEIKVLSTYRHANIVSLIGFCDEHDEKILVEYFVAYGSLDRYLTNAKLTWLKRLQICLDAARGLNHLHQGSRDGQTSVLHRDVRSRTILIDKNRQAKIAGFGLSMIVPMQSALYVNDGFVEPGYVDPIYLQSAVLTKESDVYSFGVVLFEVLCGRVAYERNGDNKQYLGPFARLHYREGKLNNLIDPILREQMSPDSLEVFSNIAYQCLEKNRTARPTMTDIVQGLIKVLRIQEDFAKALALQQVALDLKRKEDEADSYKVTNLEHLKIPLEQIKLATNNFHDDFKIGRGGYGKVYKADLFHFDVQKYVTHNVFKDMSVTELLGFQRRKSTVAVKRLDRRYGQGTAEFLQEISVLPYFRHQNLVTLVGFCDEDRERILVYEYASNGSLDEYISSTGSRNNHTWALRLQICLDAARGLEFLHNGVGEHHRIIHRDIKSSNILLGHNWVGKISDFGLSRIGPANLQATFVMTQVAGTPEYVDPEYHNTGVLTKGSDVYSFGVVLVEVLSGRLAYFPRSKDDREFLPRQAKRCFEENNVKEIIDPELMKEFEKYSTTTADETFPDSVRIFAKIAYKCLQNRADRPTMTHIVEELQNSLKSHVKGVEALRTSLETIIHATNDFSDVMEQEGHGKVYRGRLCHSEGHKLVIIKRLDHKVGTYGNEFYKEIAMLYSYNHNNVIPILGFCEEDSERIVVFEHMVNGSLKDHVKNPRLTWKQRLKISVDAAHGLAYIHNIADIEHSVHGDIKSSCILLNHDWKAFISNFIISKGRGTLGYCDPLYEITGILTQKSDVYSFGVVLLEILFGRLAIETLHEDHQQPLDGGEDGQVIFLSKLASRCFENQRPEEVIFHAIKGQSDAKSLVIFSTIANQCLRELPEDRPTMGTVVKELEKAYECQDDWEWEQKLPKDYKKILDMSTFLVSNTSPKKALYSLISSGILLNDGKLWFSINADGVNNEMISARKFSYKNVKWRSIRKSRFSKVAKILDISNLIIQAELKPQLLTPGIMYGAYLVFKFCNRRKIYSLPLYVNLRYKKDGETLNAYFAEWRAGSEWLMVELFRFRNSEESTDSISLLLENFSRYHCGNLGVFVEGIEFIAILGSQYKENDKLNDEKKVRGLLKPELDKDSVERVAIDYKEIYKRSENYNQDASKEELYLLLLKGILIDKGEKLFSLGTVNGKKCHMLPAKAFLYDTSNVSYNRIPQTKCSCSFAEFVEILPCHELRMKCNIETQLLSSDTTYACFLVFKLPVKCRGLKYPVKARDLLPHKKERTNIISFTPPSIVNLDKIKWIPKQREDGWMEVIVWETIFHRHHEEYIPMDLKLICFEGTLSGLTICGIEFRPM